MGKKLIFSLVAVGGFAVFSVANAMMLGTAIISASVSASSAISSSASSVPSAPCPLPPVAYGCQAVRISAYTCGYNVVCADPTASTTSNVVGPGAHCGGFIAYPNVCETGYTCALSSIPDVGGTCVPVATSTPVAGSPVITSISPQSGPSGIMVTITGSGFGVANVVLMNGLVASTNISSADKSTISFLVPRTLTPNCASGLACPQFALLVTPNTYQVSVLTNGATSNSKPFIVTGSSTLPTPIPGGSDTPSVGAFVSRLGPGSTGAEVYLLQYVLAKDGDFPSALFTGRFGSLTEAALEAFQTKYNIVISGNSDSTGYGVTGPKTRVQLNALL